MVHAIGSSHCSQQLHTAKFESYSTVQQGLSSASSLRTAAEADKKAKAPASASTSGGISGCISRVATSIKNFFCGIANWFLGLCGKGSQGSSSSSGKSKLEMYVAAMLDKDAKVKAQRKAFDKISNKDLNAVAKQLLNNLKAKNKERKKLGVPQKALPSLRDLQDYAKLHSVEAKVLAAVEAVVDGRAQAAAKK